MKIPLKMIHVMGGIPCGSPIRISRDGKPVGFLDTDVRTILLADNGMEIPLEHIARFERTEQAPAPAAKK